MWVNFLSTLRSPEAKFKFNWTKRGIFIESLWFYIIRIGENPPLSVHELLLLMIFVTLVKKRLIVENSFRCMAIPINTSYNNNTFHTWIRGVFDTFYAMFSYNVQEIVRERHSQVALNLSGLSKNCSVSGHTHFNPGLRSPP